ncbi:MAG TPA: histidine kinase, partial [Vicinamibacterales bacterium]|nr:histidine kinase [Vicinamibacterales bacterium]
MNTRRLALWLLGPLTLLALLLSMQLYVVYRTEGLPMSFSGLLLLQVGHWYLWAIAGPVAWTAANRLPLRGSHKIRNIARHVGIAVAVSLTVVGLYVALTYAVVRLPLMRGWFLEMDRSRPLAALAAFFFFAYFHIELMAYAVIFAIAHAVRSGGELRAREREALELSSQLATARLQVLTAQLQPHFLFNTLHTIGSLILQRKNDEAVRILAELGELLRMTLHRQTAESIPLSLEIEHLMRYLRIEEARFGDRLDVRWEVDDASLGALVPPL